MQFPVGGLPPRQPIPGLRPSLAERIRSWPRWVWFIVAVVAVPMASIPVMGLARFTTSSSAYCLTCHSTGETPDRGVRSLVHPDFDRVTCVDCHAKPGQIVFEGYYKGFMAEPERVNDNCLRCHRVMTQTNEQTGFKFNFLDIRITHKDHLERGASCTTCHANVAHDLHVPKTNRPTMQACYTCHAVSDACTKCHTKNVPAGPVPVPAPATAGMLGDGRVYYLRVCSACHGPKGDRLQEVDLSSQEYLDSLGDARLAKVIAEGKGVMPGFGQESGGPLSRDQIKAVIGYLRSEAVGRGQPDPEALYNKNCVVCHGESGDKVAGVRHSDPEFWRRALPAELFRAVDRGKGGMPAMGKAEGGPLTHQEIQAVLDFLRRRAGAGAAEGSTPIDGRELYEKNCAACHGPRGDQIPSANLGAKDYLASKGDAALVEATANGKGGMPAFGRAKGGALDDSQIRAIIEYLKSR